MVPLYEGQTKNRPVKAVGCRNHYQLQIWNNSFKKCDKNDQNIKYWEVLFNWAVLKHGNNSLSEKMRPLVNTKYQYGKNPLNNMDQIMNMSYMCKFYYMGFFRRRGLTLAFFFCHRRWCLFWSQIPNLNIRETICQITENIVRNSQISYICRYCYTSYATTSE